MTQILDLGNVIGSYTLTGQDKTDIANIIAAMPEWRGLINAVINSRLDDNPTQGSTNLMTSGAIYNAFHTFTPDRVFDDLDSPRALTSPELNKEYYFTNGRTASNTLSITLPAIASDGDKFSLEFRSTGTSEVYAVITSLDVEEGGRLLTVGELSEQAYATTINCIYSSGIWLATIAVYKPTAGIDETTYGTLVYSGANRAYFALLTGGCTITRSVIVGLNRLELASSLTPTGSAYSFANLYGMQFAGWNTKEDGSGESYHDHGLVTLADAVEPLTLYPQYTPRVIERMSPDRQIVLYPLMSNYVWYEGHWGYPGTPENPTKKVDLKIGLAASGLADYTELTIKVKLWGDITRGGNEHPSSSYDDTHGAYINIEGVGTLIASNQYVPVGGVYSDWITLTRETPEDDFIITVVLGANNGSGTKYSTWACSIDALRIE